MPIKILPKTSLTFLPADDEPPTRRLSHDLWAESQAPIADSIQQLEVETLTLKGEVLADDLYTGDGLELGVCVADRPNQAMVRLGADYEFEADQALALGEYLISAALDIQARRAAS